MSLSRRVFVGKSMGALGAFSILCSYADSANGLHQLSSNQYSMQIFLLEYQALGEFLKILIILFGVARLYMDLTVKFMFSIHGGKKDIGFGGWLTACEIAHAVGDKPEGPFKTSDIALAPRGGDWWDGGSCHNPTIHKVGEKYVLFYMGASDGTVYSKRVGIAISDSLYGPWERKDMPIILPNPDPDAWNSVCTTNPAFVPAS